MAKSLPSSIRNAKGKYLLVGEASRFGAEKNAAIFSGRAAREMKAELVGFGPLAVVDAPQAAVDREAKVVARVSAMKAKEKEKAAKEKAKSKAGKPGKPAKPKAARPEAVEA